MDQHRRVLVVDDEADIRALLTAALRERDLLVDQAAGGAEAIELLASQRYAVVLLDLLMPNVDGFAVLNAIEQNGDHTIVLVVSGADRRVLDQLDSTRIHGIVKKPFDPIELASVVQACSEIKARSAFETMALATMLSGAPLLALLHL